MLKMFFKNNVHLAIHALFDCTISGEEVRIINICI